MWKDSAHKIIALLLIASTLGAEEGAHFLKIPVGAKYGAMGHVGAVAEGAEGVFYNPASIHKIKEKEAFFSFTNYFLDTSLHTLSFCKRISKSCHFGIGATYFDAGTLHYAKEDESGAYIGEGGKFYASDLLLLLSLSKRIRSFAFGVSVKSVTEKLEKEKAATLCWDAGFIFERGRVTVGAALQNIGGRMKIGEEFKLPFIKRVAVAYNKGRAHLLAECKVGSKPSYHLGAQLSLSSLLLRAGYIKSESVDTGITAGFGVRIKGFELDYAYTPYARIGELSTHQFSLSLSW